MVAVGILSRLGYQSLVVDDGREAVEAVTGGRYGAVLMDGRLPGLDGYQATAEIRRREGTARRTPIIAMTAAASREDHQRCLAAGMDDYVTKPMLVADVEAVLSRWLQGDARATPLATGNDDPAPELVDVFLAAAPGDLRGLHAAVAGGDASAVDHLAHHLKGAAVTLGLAAMAELCEELELLGSAAALDPAPDVLSRLEEAFEQVRGVLLPPEVAPWPSAS
jgi:CheY-like chemotaxis protein